MSENQPSATETLHRAFLFTDLIGSANLKWRLGDAPAAAAIADHDALLRDCLARGGGVEEKETGEGFAARFDCPSEAVHCALDFMRRLNDLAPGVPLRVRIGIHSARIVPLAGGANAEHRDKLIGPALDTAGRVMGLAEAGQILLTRSAFDSARRQVRAAPDGSPVEWLAHGPYIFKAMQEPLEIFEVGVRGVAPLRPPTNLEKARRATAFGDEATLGWRPAAGLAIPRREAWELQRPIGEGDLGEVWLARHRRSGEHRAFKFCFNAERLRMLKREPTLLRLIEEVLGERPDIARLYDAQLDSAPYYLEMEYGAGLGDWAEGKGGIARIALETRLEIIAQVADALAAAHSVGVIHKGVRPRNVLMEELEGGKVQARLTDFGIGRPMSLEPPDEAGIAAEGTRLYIAPELAAGGEPSIASDVYSLGVMLYQVLAGDLARPLGQGWQREVHDELLAQDIASCVDDDPARRLTTASQLAGRLRGLEGRRAAREAERRAAEELERNRRLAARAARGRKLVYAAGVLGAIALAAISFVALDQSRLRQEADRAAEDATARSRIAEEENRETTARFERTETALAEIRIALRDADRRAREQAERVSFLRWFGSFQPKPADSPPPAVVDRAATVDASAPPAADHPPGEGGLAALVRKAAKRSQTPPDSSDEAILKAEPPRAPEPKPAALYTEAFDHAGGLAGWSGVERWSNESHGVRAAGGPGAQGSGLTLLTTERGDFSDFALEVDIERAGGAQFGVLVRVGETDAGRPRGVGLFFDGQRLLWRDEPASFLYGLPGSKFYKRRMIEWAPKKRFRLRLEARGARFTAFVDGERIGDYEKQGLDAGAIALGFDPRLASPSALYKNLRLSALEATR